VERRQAKLPYGTVADGLQRIKVSVTEVNFRGLSDCRTGSSADNDNSWTPRSPNSGPLTSELATSCIHLDDIRDGQRRHPVPIYDTQSNPSYLPTVDPYDFTSELSGVQTGFG